MRKIMQTNTDEGKGNCMQAALASLFGKKLSETVNVAYYEKGKWAIPFINWIESIGFDCYGVKDAVKGAHQNYGELLKSESVNGLFIAVVPSVNFDGVTHSVIINYFGVVVHDPHPEKKWLGVDIIGSGDLMYWYIFEDK